MAISFNEFQDYQYAINELCFLMDDENDILNEGKLDDILSKVGFKIHKTKGIIHHLSNAGKGVANLFIAAIKGDVKGAKAILNTVKREDVMDFLLKLDQATLHLITGPIHFIHAVTGWDLELTKEKPKESIDKIKGLFSSIRQTFQHFTAKKRNKYNKFLDRIQSDVI